MTVVIIDTEEPRAIAAAEPLHTGDVGALSQLLRDHPDLARTRLGGDPDGCGDGRRLVARSARATLWTQHLA